LFGGVTRIEADLDYFARVARAGVMSDPEDSGYEKSRESRSFLEDYPT
jgi:hypothetical protein